MRCEDPKTLDEIFGETTESYGHIKSIIVGKDTDKGEPMATICYVEENTGLLKALKVYQHKGQIIVDIKDI